MAYDAYYSARDTILDFIVKDAIGPIEKYEVLQEPPLDTYVCGILWPKGTSTTDVILYHETQADGSEEKSPDKNTGAEIEDDLVDNIREANQFRPSVMAISFALPNSIDSIKVSFNCAVYENVDKPVEGKEYVLHEYKRSPLTTGVLTITLPDRNGKRSLIGGRAMLHVVRRHIISDDSSLWTIAIENTKCASKDEIAQNTSSLFQCVLTVNSKFVPIDNGTATSGDKEHQKMGFLYRDTHSYAAGHGCSAFWNSDGESITEVKSTFLPVAVVPQMVAIANESLSCFRMSSWIDVNREQVLLELTQYIQTYSEWLESLRNQRNSIPQVYKSISYDILLRVEECIERLKSGIKVLSEDNTAWRAFCLMNKAMMRQSAKKRMQPESDVSWYPFQLCYVLMVVPDMVDSGSNWHDTVDLLWFPTGGGKTEAYLGVAAFTIFYRRLTKGELGKGVTVLMRYTLRMLTAQQCERAASLICECDLLRRQENIPGGEITIGLWVGSEVTPNHVVSDNPDMESAESILNKVQSGFVDEIKSSPIQLSTCPYCGEVLKPQNAYTIRDRHFRTHCPNSACPFHNDLPIVTVDDDIYDRKPTLLIGTIDKFVRLVWEVKTRALFAEDGIGMPPALLIQDELHLISGPLGSIDGLYEIAIEKLIEHNGKKPKILASTATLRNAEAQIKDLYGRPTFQFPPSGFTAEDSFFARNATADERPQRMYVGYCETGGSLADAVVRIFGVVKFALQYLSGIGIDSAVIDQFWTNVGYFNSLKDLGTADTLIIDRVCAYAESLRKHKFSDYAAKVNMTPISNEYEYGELTSRKNAREIAVVRNQLDKEHYPNPAALNYVLSSNMLSVGIDINRLGLMTVYGQPKATAEYIQATSRVGRSNPGLVSLIAHVEDSG